MKITGAADIRLARLKRGFTLIELLVVVLILSILMAVALPLYLSAVSDSQRKTCRANMQSIANCVLAARMASAATDYGVLITAGVTVASLTSLSSVPICPSAGSYTLANGSTASTATFKVKCSFGSGTAAHGTFEPGIDNN